MVDENDVSRLHPDDRRQLLEELVERLRAEPTGDLLPKTPAFATGRDARIFKAAAERVVDERGYLPPDAIRALVRDEMSDFYDDRVKQLVERSQKFVEGDEIKKWISEEVEDTFRIIGLPIDDDHRERTGQAVRGIMKWQGRIDKVLGGMAMAVLAAAFYAVLKLIGINIPSPGAGH